MIPLPLIEKVGQHIKYTVVPRTIVKEVMERRELVAMIISESKSKVVGAAKMKSERSGGWG